MSGLSEEGKKDVKKFTDWVNANSEEIPPEIVYPPKHDDHHGHGHEHKEIVIPHEETLREKMAKREHIDENFQEEWQNVMQKANDDPSSPERWYRLASSIGGALIVLVLLITVANLPRFGSPDAPAMNEVARRYLESGLQETGAVNSVAGMILDYRAFDTLGESVVLFTATVTVIFLLQQKERNHNKEDIEAVDGNYKGIRSLPAKVIVAITFPFIILYGIYIVLNGHLSPGGGFSGGAIIGAGLVLNHLVFGQEFSEKFINVNKCKKLMAGGLFVYIALKTYSILTGANGINSHIPLGKAGSIFSGGLIFPLNICVGVVVACTVFSLYSLFTDWSS
ncbi:MAG: hypothetical protein J6D29_00155 [Solobacterium sp.]|nr:hypothetical protein [Solobacterium sp.]